MQTETPHTLCGIYMYIARGGGGGGGRHSLVWLARLYDLIAEGVKVVIATSSHCESILPLYMLIVISYCHIGVDVLNDIHFLFSVLHGVLYIYPSVRLHMVHFNNNNYNYINNDSNKIWIKSQTSPMYNKNTL